MNQGFTWQHHRDLRHERVNVSKCTERLHSSPPMLVWEAK